MNVEPTVRRTSIPIRQAALLCRHLKDIAQAEFSWFKSHIAVSSVRFVMSAGRYLIPLGSNDRSVCIPQPISQTHRPSAHKAAANGARLFQLDLKFVDCDHRKWSVSRRLIDFKRRLISTNIRLSKIACMPNLGRPTHSRGRSTIFTRCFCASIITHKGASGHARSHH